MLKQNQILSISLILIYYIEDKFTLVLLFFLILYTSEIKVDSNNSCSMALQASVTQAKQF